jgi:hypothetical protein
LLYAEPWPSGRVMIYHFSIFYSQDVWFLFDYLFHCSLVWPTIVFMIMMMGGTFYLTFFAFDFALIFPRVV